MSIHDMLAEADRLAALEDELTETYARELARVLRDLERELRPLILDAQQGSTSALVRAVRGAQLRVQVRRALDAAGYPELSTTATTTSLDRLVTQVMALRGAANLAGFTSQDATRILALKRLAERDLLEQGASVAQAVWRTLAQGLLSGRSVVDLLTDLEDALEIEHAEARTLYDTLVGIFGRQVESLKASEDEDAIFTYLGPADGKTRPFCLERVGRVYTRAEIDAMDNGQLPNVFLTGGGYNCRHVWTAVSRFSSLRKLVGTGERMPEVAVQIARLVAGGRRAA